MCMKRIILTGAPDIDLLIAGTSPKDEYMHDFGRQQDLHGSQSRACGLAVEWHAEFQHKLNNVKFRDINLHVRY